LAYNNRGVFFEAFFDNIRESDITQIEIHNTLEKLTDNFKIDKLKFLQKILIFISFKQGEEKDAEFDENDIKVAIDELKKEGKKFHLSFYPKYPKM